MKIKKTTPLLSLWDYLNLQQKELWSLYFFAGLAGLIQLSLPLGIQSIINLMIYNTLTTSIYILILLVLLGLGLGGYLQIRQLQIAETIQQRLFVRKASKFTDHIPQIELTSTDGSYLPELTNRFFETVNLQKGVFKLLLDVPLASVQLIVGILLLSLYHPVFLIIALILVAIVYLIIRLTSSKGLQTSLQECENKYKVAHWLQELSRNLITFKNYNETGFHREVADDFTTDYIKFRIRHFRILQTQYWSLVLFKVLLMAGFLIIGTTLLHNQEINIGQFVAAEIVLFIIINAIEKLILSVDLVFDVLTAVEKMNALLTKTKERTGGFIVPNDKAWSVEFENVSFSYNSTSPVLENISFKLDAGKKMLIYNQTSGAGSSTVLKLLAGTHQAQTGKIKVQSTIFAHIDLQVYRSKINFMIGRPELFSGSLFDNIVVGRSKIETDQIINLVHQLGFGDFINQFPNGLQTQIYTHGIKLPSHLIKKIILLRTLIVPGQLLLLDDPLSYLDQNEKTCLLLFLKKLDATVIITSQEEILPVEFDQKFVISSNDPKHLTA
ncbi:MAG: ATP-binding cassette domain-containing protein [Saprospiraceae bacterium]|nr:ATP-binding cassette domain-containing protein [Saprospiraceae bacterium]